MLESIAIILIVLWLLGMISGYTLGNYIYLLLVVAVVLFLVRFITGPPMPPIHNGPLPPDEFIDHDCDN